MSIKNVVLQCDKQDCEQTVDIIDPEANDEGWLKRFVTLGKSLDLCQDFCPKHVPERLKYQQTER